MKSLRENRWSAFSAPCSSSSLKIPAKSDPRTIRRGWFLTPALNTRSASFALLLLAVATRLVAATTDEPADPHSEGRDLARRLCEARPTESFTNASTLIVRPAKGRKWEIPVHTVTTLAETNWMAIYDTFPGTNGIAQRLVVTHHGFRPNGYSFGGGARADVGAVCEFRFLGGGFGFGISSLADAAALEEGTEEGAILCRAGKPESPAGHQHLLTGGFVD